MGLFSIFRNSKAFKMSIEDLPANMGSTIEFIGREYPIGEPILLQIGDEVIIHPIPGKSMATKSYPAKIVVKEINWTKGYDIETETAYNAPKNELCLQGIRSNKDWYGAVLNEYGFSRLQFVRRDINQKLLKL